MASASPNELRFIARVTCPHCWHTFAPEDILWVAQNTKLMGDPKLGGHAFRRFLPTRFSPSGQAIDAIGTPCKDLACPNCHLTIPRAMLEMPPTFFSILGTPSAGKTYFMASMMHRLRQILKINFSLNFGDADTALNSVVINNENTLFGFPDSDKIVNLEKTQPGHEGHFDQVTQQGQNVMYPRPFVFTIGPDNRHPFYEQRRKLSRSICFYDNAGEDFQSGKDAATNPVVRHLLKARVVFYLFDPTQESSFRRQCAGASHDPQLRADQRVNRQEQVLMVAAECIRQLGNEEMRDRPLIVCVAKYDAWASLVGNHHLRLEELLQPSSREGLSLLNCDRVEQESATIRMLLMQQTPHIVAAAENFSSKVIYIPCSSLGRSPVVDSATGAFGIRPKDLKPMRIEAPFLYAVCRYLRGLVLAPTPKDQQSEAGVVQMPMGPQLAGHASSADFPRVWEDTGS